MHKLCGFFKFKYYAPLSKFPFFLLKYNASQQFFIGIEAQTITWTCEGIIIVIDLVLLPGLYSDWNSDTQRENTTLFTQ